MKEGVKIKPDAKANSTKKPSIPPAEEIKPDFPLSEKDEVKKAEKNLRESQKKNG